MTTTARQRTRAGSPRPPGDEPPFSVAVFDVLRRVPRGRVITYGDVARLAGRPGAARAVGQLMASGTNPRLPYHRVVRAGGVLGGYGSGPAFKTARLATEGVVVRRGRVADFRIRRWPG